MLVRRVIEDEIDEDAHLPLVRFSHELIEVRHRPVVGIDRTIVGDVVARVLERRGVHRHEPERVDAEVP